MNSPDKEKKAKYLVDQLLSNNYTIVLGAGISSVAKLEDITPEDIEDIKDILLEDPKNEYKPHETKNMIRTVKNVLCSKEADCVCKKCNKYKNKICELCNEECESKEVSECNIRKENSLGRLCERFLWLRENEENNCKEGNKNDNEEKKFELLIDLLKIRLFNCLKPTDAHYYIALLAREGLVSDVITTNYDCCLERAYFKTWGVDKCRGKNKCENDYCKNNTGRNYNRSQVARITDQKSFILQASRREWESEENNASRLKRRVLRVYKINGCACEVNKGNDEKDKKPILLTDTQLQDWRERRWAADFFRNRLRTTSLVFSGFGSDEPQILHTIQKVFEEFSSDNSTNGFDFDIDELTNVPVIHSFESKTQYVHEYIARQYVSSINSKKIEFNNLIIKKRDVNKKKNNGEQKKDEKLFADEFWQFIYLEIFKKLANQILEKR